MAAAIGQASVTHASQGTFANISKSPIQESSPESHGFAALLESTSQSGGMATPMTQSGIEPSISLYLQQLEKSPPAVKPIEDTDGSGEIDLGQSGSQDATQSLWKISQGG